MPPDRLVFSYPIRCLDESSSSSLISFGVYKLTHALACFPSSGSRQSCHSFVHIRPDTRQSRALFSSHIYPDTMAPVPGEYYGPDEDEYTKNLERFFLAGDFICGVGYGMPLS